MTAPCDGVSKSRIRMAYTRSVPRREPTGGCRAAFHQLPLSVNPTPSFFPRRSAATFPSNPRRSRPAASLGWQATGLSWLRNQSPALPLVNRSSSVFFRIRSLLPLQDKVVRPTTHGLGADCGPSRRGTRRTLGRDRHGRRQVDDPGVDDEDGPPVHRPARRGHVGRAGEDAQAVGRVALVFPSRTGRMLAPKTVSSVLGSPMWIRRCTGFLEAAASAKGSFRAIRGSSGYLRAVESPQIDDLRSPRGTGRVESDHPRRETGPGRPARDVPAPLHTTSPEPPGGCLAAPLAAAPGESRTTSYNYRHYRHLGNFLSLDLLTNGLAAFGHGDAGRSVHFAGERVSRALGLERDRVRPKSRGRPEPDAPDRPGALTVVEDGGSDSGVHLGARRRSPQCAGSTLHTSDTGDRPGGCEHRGGAGR